MMRILTDSRFEVGSGEADGETGTAGVLLASGRNSWDIGGSPDFGLRNNVNE